MAEAGATNLPTGGDGIARRIDYLKEECEKLLPDIRERLTETRVLIVHATFVCTVYRSTMR